MTFDSKYAVRVITRNAQSAIAKELAALPNVTIFEGNPYDEETLFKAFSGIDFAFVNTNGFAIGQALEIYWGIRMYEIAAFSGVKHFIWSGLEYASKLGKFDPKYKTGHLDGKAKVTDYLAAQPTSPMAWTVLTSAPYVEMLSEMLAPHPDPADPEGVVFYLPVGNAAVPLIHTADLGRYARWALETPERSAGLNLHIATEDIRWNDLAEVFTKVTGKKARYQAITQEQLFSRGTFKDPDALVGHGVSTDNGTFQTYRGNFGGFWNTWHDEITARDYKLLDEILPNRVKSVEEWMRLTGYTGERKSVLKDYADGLR